MTAAMQAPENNFKVIHIISIGVVEDFAPFQDSSNNHENLARKSGKCSGLQLFFSADRKLS